MSELSRHLNWDGCLNTRDLGGLPTLEHGITRWRSIVRSDNLNRLSPRGRDAVLAYGIRTVIDLRGSDEIRSGSSVFAAPLRGTRSM